MPDVSRRAALLAPLAALPARAQAAFPARPISLVVPLPPGGTTDAISRAFAARMADDLGRPVVIDNRAGAGHSVAYAHVARATPDGYTVLMGINSLAVNPALRTDLAYAPLSDFAPVSMVARGAFALAVNPNLAAGTVAELVALAKRDPGGIEQASTGVGSLNHLAGALFQRRAGVHFTHVPYRGGAQASADVIAGRVPVIFLAMLEALPFLPRRQAAGAGGHLVRAGFGAAQCADAGGKRPAWLRGGVLAGAVRARADAGADRGAAERRRPRAAADRALVADMAGRGITIAASLPEALGTLLARESEEWATLVRAAGITAAD